MRTHPIIITLGIFMLLTLVPAPAPAQETPSILTLTLRALEELHPAFAANEASLAAARAGHASGEAVLRSQIDVSVPSSGTDLPLVQASGLEFNNLYSVTSSPRIGVSRLLPSGGTLSVSLDDSLNVSNYDVSSNIYYESPEPEWANTLTASFGVRQPLVFRGVYDATVSRLEYSFNTDLADYRSVRNSLVLQAVRDVYDYKLAAYRVSLVRSRQENDTEVYKRVEREYEMGLWSRVKLVQARAALLQTEADFLKAEQTLQASLRRLSSMYGLQPADETVTGILNLAGEKEEDTEIIETALRENPDLIKLRNSIATVRSDLILKAKEHAPSIDAGVTYSYNRVLEEDGAEVHSAYFNLAFSASLSDGGAFREAQRQRHYRIESLSSRLREEEIGLRARIYSLTDTIQSNIRLAELYTLQEEAARFDYESGQKDFEMGQITRNDLMDKQVNLENIQLTIQTNTIEGNVALLELYALTGRDIHQWLQNRIKQQAGM